MPAAQVDDTVIITRRQMEGEMHLCVKRHKEWHQCSGKRDPTAKVPKAQLFTPAGIDHDFNFITGIERSRASLETKLPQSKRLEGSALRAGIASKNKNVRERLDLTRVTIEWAPMGLSRQKLNQSKWSKKTRQIVWTVEWIHQDGENEFHQVLDSAPICREYTPIFLRRNNVETGRKRRRVTGSSKSDALAEHETHAQACASLSSSNKCELEEDSVEQEKAAGPSFLAESAPDSTVEHAADSQTLQPSKRAAKPDSAASATLQSYSGKTSSLSELLRQPPGSPDERGNYYYLLKPRTTGMGKVLTVLSPTDCLRDCLKDQTVLEFPSIQVLSCPPHALPNGFILVHNWLDSFNKEHEEMKRLVDEAGGLEAEETLPGANEDNLPPGLQAMSNADDILAILQEDVLERRVL
ncbi:hypothetical protein FKW77_009133 [Venturia effusa]|uniref:BCD1 alpha/beta domain-containing protein n=1 Tax=Venturia effusa TaxID=50376 RepID=A0A517LG64_9PEZI|nr:hypothetical protein FKW77_009133 [Venturia effusa]